MIRGKRKSVLGGFGGRLIAGCVFFLLVLGSRLNGADFPPAIQQGRSADPVTHTFSIVAFDPDSGELGVAVESKYFGVGSVVPWAEAGVGAVATQARAKVAFGPEGLRLLKSGKPPKEVLDTLLSSDAGSDERQVAIMDAHGRAAAHTGSGCLNFAGDRQGKNYSVQGNLLAGKSVLAAMAEGFESARDHREGDLADWLLAALKAGQAAGGDRRGQQSAALLVVRTHGGPGGDTDRCIDLRVEDHPTPIEELARLRALHRQFYGPPPTR